MNHVDAATAPLAAGAAVQAASTSDRIECRPQVYLGCTIFALVITVLLGKDLPWDTLDYHLYAGFSAINDRFGRDYFAAGVQSYFTPYAYVPFYLLVRVGLPSIVISALLALVQSMILWLSFEIALCICPLQDKRPRLTFGLFAIGLTAVNPILLQEFGSSFSDITTAIPVLGAWLLLLHDLRLPRASCALGAGTLVGLATALKLTNAVHALSGGVVLLLLPVGWTQKLRHGAYYGVSLLCAFVAMSAPWSIRLWHVFRNPVFPILNNLFHSAEYPIGPVNSHRFIPSNIWEAIWRPFAMLNPVPMIQEEMRAPDLRYALLIILALFLAGRGLFELRARRPRRVASQPGVFRLLEDRLSRIFIALALAFLVDWVLWLKEAGNGRYFLAMSCVAGALIVGLLYRLASHKVRNYAFLAIFACQMLQLWWGADFRWEPVPWRGPWLKVTIPEVLTAQPALYFSDGIQSNSFLVPFLPKESGVINFTGGYALGPEGANGEHIATLVRRYSPHLRILVSGSRLYGDDDKGVDGGSLRLSQVDGALARFNLKVNASDCVRIIVQGLPHHVLFTYGGKKPSSQPADLSYFLTCGLVQTQIDQAVYQSKLQAANTVFGRLESECPALFQPSGLRTDDDGTTWRRIYVNTDLVVWISNGTIKLEDPPHHGPVMRLGREVDWLRGSQPLNCGRNGAGDFYAEPVVSR